MNCIFCDIVNGVSSSKIIYEDNSILSFLDIYPVSFGHSLIIPKKHYESLLEVPPELLSEMMPKVQQIGLNIKTCIEADGFNLVANTGRAAGQSVFHFHFHIIPRFSKDNFSFHPKYISYKSDEFNLLHTNLKEHLKKEVKDGKKD